MLMGVGNGEDEGDGGDEGALDAGEERITNAPCPMPNSQFPIPNYDMSIFSFFIFLKGTRTKL